MNYYYVVKTTNGQVSSESKPSNVKVTIFHNGVPKPNLRTGATAHMSGRKRL